MLEVDNTRIQLTVEEMEGYLSKSYSRLINNNVPLKKFPSVMLWGPPGVGKSQGIKQVANEIELNTGKKVVVTDVRLLLFNPVDLRGIPTSNEDKTLAVWLKPKIFQMDESEDVVNILFLDEISAAPQSVQAAAYQITLDRVIGEHKLPENCIVIAAGNRVTDKSVAYKMPKALANRLCHIEIKDDVDSWHKWAVNSGIHRIVTGFIDYNPSALMGFSAEAEDNAFPTPRAWEMVSNIFTYVSEDISEVFPLVMGCIGSDAAYALRAWCEIYKNIPDVKRIFDGTEESVPKRAETLYALIPDMVSYARRNGDEEKINNSIEFAMGMPVEFRNKLFVDYLGIKSIRRCLKKNSSFNDWLMRNGLEDECYEDDEPED